MSLVRNSTTRYFLREKNKKVISKTVSIQKNIDVLVEDLDSMRGRFEYTAYEGLPKAQKETPYEACLRC